MHAHPRSLTLTFFLALLTSAGCGVGSTGGGGGGGGGDGGGGGGSVADAIPPDPITCITDYTVTAGDVTHAVTPAGSCDGTGTWTITVGDATANDDYGACSDAPGDATYNITVTGTPKNYTGSDNDDPSRVWTVQIDDKGGSCSGSFVWDAGGGVTWAVNPSENGPDGPLMGVAHYVTRNQ